MSSAVSLIKNAAVYSFANILNAAVPFLLLPILTRVLLPAEYGVLAMYNSTLGVLGAFTGLSVHGAVNVRFVDRENINFPRYVGSSLWVLLSTTLITFVVVAGMLQPISEFTSIPSGWLLVAVLVSGCNFLIQVRLGIWLMDKKPVIYGVYQLFLSLLNVGLSLVFVLHLHLGYAGSLLGQVVAVCLVAMVGLWSLISGGWVNFRPSIEYMQESLRFGFPLVPHVIGGLLIGLADRFIINQKLGLEAAGTYMIAVQIGMGINLLSGAFNKSFVPWLYEKLNTQTPDSRFQIVKGTWIYFGVALILAAVVAMASHLAILVVAGDRYMNAAPALAWIGLGQAFCGMYLMVTNYIFYKRQTRCLAFVTPVAGMVGMSMTWFLIPLLGITGAGVSFTIAMFLRFIMTWAFAQHLCPMPWLSPFRQAVRASEEPVQ